MEKSGFINTVVTENQYFPVINFFCTSVIASNIVLEACENFQKTSFRNRCVVASSNGLVALSIPLKFGREQKKTIRQVEIDSSTKWRNTHWRTISACYRKSPFYEYYAEDVKQLIFSEEENLFSFNLEILKWLVSRLKLQVEISETLEFLKTYDNDEIIDLRNRWLPKNFQDLKHFPKYSQVFEDKIGFQANVSILDLLFNEGPNSINVLKQHFSSESALTE